MIPFGFALLLQVKGIYGSLSKGTIKFPTKPTSICWIPGYIPLVLVLVAVVGGGGEVEFPKLVLYPEQKTFVSLKNKHVHHVFFRCLGQDGKNQSIFELIDAGTSRALGPWQVLGGHFRVIFRCSTRQQMNRIQW